MLDRWINRLKNRTGLFYKLVAGYLLLLVIMALPCAYSIIALSNIQKVAKDLVKRNLELSTTVEYLRGVVPSLEGEARRYVTLYKEDSYKSFLELADDYSQKLSTIIEECRSCSDRSRALQEHLAAMVVLVKGAHERTPSKDSPGLTLQASEQEEEVKSLATNMMEDLSRVEASLKEDLRLKSQLISSQTTQAKQLTIIIFVCALGFALGAPWFLYQYIKRPIDRLRLGAQAIGEGHFDQRIPVRSNDELGQLAAVFNDMAQKLKELDKLKSDFIAVASHELKTPLSSMIEAAKLLNEPKIGELTPKQQKLVNILNESMGKFKRLIEELLDLSRLQAGLVPIQKQPCDISALLSEVVDTLTPLAESSDVRLKLVQDLESSEIMIDRDRMLRAFLNLIENAVKFSPSKAEVKIRLKSVEIRGKGKKGIARYVKIGVIDAGPGITQREKDRIFDKFYQIQTIRKKGGIGLGLAIAKEIILAHGGKIWVESPPQDKDAVTGGKGAAFWVQLPC